MLVCYSHVRALAWTHPNPNPNPNSGLLLVFRTNSSYQRWLEARKAPNPNPSPSPSPSPNPNPNPDPNQARKAWGRIVSHCRNIMRQATLWNDAPDDAAANGLDELSLCVWAFPRSLWAHLSDPAKEPRFAAEVRSAFGDEAAPTLLDARHRPLRALHMLSGAMDRLPIDEKKKVS